MPSPVEEEWRRKLLSFRRDKDHYFLKNPHSPIPADRRGGLKGLPYYEPDPALRFVLRPERLTGLPPVTLQTSDGQVRSYRPAARLTFAVAGQQASLVGYEQEEEWFVPFRDATSGKETYGAGRYLEVHAGPEVELDFNYAYNPFCAYSDDYSCPFPPHENWLRVPIRAGERDFLKL